MARLPKTPFPMSRAAGIEVGAWETGMGEIMISIMISMMKTNENDCDKTVINYDHHNIINYHDTSNHHHHDKHPHHHGHHHYHLHYHNHDYVNHRKGRQKSGSGDRRGCSLLQISCSVETDLDEVFCHHHRCNLGYFLQLSAVVMIESSKLLVCQLS